MPHAYSPDGTAIGYDHLSDDGAMLVLIGGALDDGTENVPLGEYLTGSFAVVNYRRRGRGDSSDGRSYAVEREVEDLAAVIDAAGGRAHLFGASSGGALAFEAAASGLPVDRIAVHEVPYQVDDASISAWQSYRADLDAALEAGDREEALRLFMRLAGSSVHDISGAEASPMWPALQALASTLRYDAACLGDGPVPADRLSTVRQPVLLTTGAVVDPHMGGLPVDFFGAAADAAAAALPDARRATLEVEGHVADPAVLGPLLEKFYGG
ncbi:alpha/beta hydrolase [Rhodococcus sp. BP-149]|uniref:alpha/beta fold hydrolase n=1 Tax=unclassified Rhodococcus (in: high G+C Gram-positive bacteria) TaxID=192944 RepID=UPI001C9BB836|nr:MULTISPECIES: alpha/beta hydrolase [unclassified Rhodococcus (in: high G+C Gram-positive bacteria)]MBY6686126.1 alpha/beta hydrolase [Rhodococcus sp. BP-288]MBY6693784.1 alpha/beta hydrolase [Rhodococcus sp. BP-188]MBY6699619.1 alpha/beta hydrolase [Rhodococcus sp. BP-285]MBY6704036.1 alpha/beta hydrolase [Rhodococcus sp. BP-283]MBY6710815.1 alpha/beta hydrolase [Rhodococcus sp. BP-160]